MDQFQRHFFIRRPGRKTIPAVTPFVEEYRIFPEREKAYILENFVKPYAVSASTADQLLSYSRSALLESLEGEDPGEDDFLHFD